MSTHLFMRLGFGGIATRSLVLAVLLTATFAVLSAKAMAETRSLSLFDWKTGETLKVIFKRDGIYDAEGLQRLNEFLRDRRANKSIVMDPRLFDGMWEFYRKSDSRYPIYIISGYRESSPLLAKRTLYFGNGLSREYGFGLNKDGKYLTLDPVRESEDSSTLEERMLLEKLELFRNSFTRKVPRSQHQFGRAVDFFLVDVPPDKVLEILRDMGQGKAFVIRGVNAPRIHFDISNTGG